MLAGDTLHHAPHAVVALVFEVELQAVGIWTAEIVHNVGTIDALNPLAKVGLVQENGASGIVAMGTHPQGPVLIPARLIADVTGKGLPHREGGLRGFVAFRTANLLR